MAKVFALLRIFVAAELIIHQSVKNRIVLTRRRVTISYVEQAYITSVLTYVKLVSRKSRTFSFITKNNLITSHGYLAITFTCKLTVWGSASLAGCGGRQKNKNWSSLFKLNFEYENTRESRSRAVCAKVASFLAGREPAACSWTCYCD